MSEYQYYEFQAIERPLTEQDRQDLRAISTRAQITVTSFTNHYEWGDFKGEPDKFMERWFDLHLYLANWGTRRLMIRLPKELFDQSQLDRFIGEVDHARYWVAGEHLILDILFEDVGIDEGEDWSDDTHWLSVLGLLRDDLLAGDLRVLYLLSSLADGNRIRRHSMTSNRSRCRESDRLQERWKRSWNSSILIAISSRRRPSALQPRSPAPSQWSPHGS